MKLCIVASGDFFSTYGGGQVYVKNLVDELIRQADTLHISLSIISCDAKFTPEGQTKEYQHIPVVEIHPKGNIEIILKNLAPNVVHAHGEKATIAKLCHKLNIRCLITAHHGGILCPAGSLLNTQDKICHIQANFNNCLPCYLRNIRTGSFWYPMLKHISFQNYLRLGNSLKHLPFIPFITPLGEAATSIQQKLEDWSIIKDNANILIAPSSAIANSMQLNEADKSKIKVVPHGIPVPNGSFPFPDTTHGIKFYYVGRICYVKGIHVLLKAFSKIEDSNVELHLLGGAGNKTENRYQSRLQHQYQYDERIIWHGIVNIERLPNLIKDYHVLVHPAIYLEVFGLNITEGLSLNKWVIATKCGGAEMQIVNDKNGFLVDPNNIEQLTQKMEDYIKMPSYNKEKQIIPISQHVNNLYKFYQIC